jgi:hypothetical protein
VGAACAEVGERGGVGEEERGGAGSCESHMNKCKSTSNDQLIIRFIVSYADTTIESNLL